MAMPIRRTRRRLGLSRPAANRSPPLRLTAMQAVDESEAGKRGSQSSESKRNKRRRPKRANWLTDPKTKVKIRIWRRSKISLHLPKALRETRMERYRSTKRRWWRKQSQSSRRKMQIGLKSSKGRRKQRAAGLSHQHQLTSQVLLLHQPSPG